MKRSTFNKIQSTFEKIKSISYKILLVGLFVLYVGSAFQVKKSWDSLVQKTYYGKILNMYPVTSGSYARGIVSVDFGDIGIRTLSLSPESYYQFNVGSIIGYDFSKNELNGNSAIPLLLLFVSAIYFIIYSVINGITVYHVICDIRDKFISNLKDDTNE